MYESSFCNFLSSYQRISKDVLENIFIMDKLNVQEMNDGYYFIKKCKFKEKKKL